MVAYCTTTECPMGLKSRLMTSVVGMKNSIHLLKVTLCLCKCFIMSQMAQSTLSNPTSPKPQPFQRLFSNQGSHLDSDRVAVRTSRLFEFMIPSVVVSSCSYLAWHVAQNVWVCFKCVSRRVREWVSVCLSHFNHSQTPACCKCNQCVTWQHSPLHSF